MRIDLQIPAHLGNEVAADLFLPILEGCEFLTEIQTAVASLSLVAHEFADALLPPGEPPWAALELRTLHNSMVGHFCPSVKGGSHGNQAGAPTLRPNASGEPYRYFCARSVSIAFSIWRSWPPRKSAGVFSTSTSGGTPQFSIFSPAAVNTPAPGVRIAEPSSSVNEPVPITCPEVGTPISLPRPRARKPSGNISASLADRSYCRLLMATAVSGSRSMVHAPSGAGLEFTRNSNLLPGRILNTFQ